MAKQIYVYIVLFAAFIMLAAGVYMLFSCLADYIAPTDFYMENTLNSLIKSFGYILVPLPIIIYFNSLRKQLKD